MALNDLMNQLDSKLSLKKKKEEEQQRREEQSRKKIEQENKSALDGYLKMTGKILEISKIIRDKFRIDFFPEMVSKEEGYYAHFLIKPEFAHQTEFVEISTWYSSPGYDTRGRLMCIDVVPKFQGYPLNIEEDNQRVYADILENYLEDVDYEAIIENALRRYFLVRV